MEMVVVLIHGMWLPLRLYENWRRWLECLGFRVLTVNLRLAGPRASLRDYVKEAERQIKQGAPDKRLVVIGHSLGGRIALSLVSRGKLNIIGLVSVGCAPPAGILFRGRILLAILRYLPRIILGLPFRITEEDARSLLLSSVDEPGGFLDELLPESGRAARSVILHMAWTCRRRIRSTPILFVIGGQDKLIVPSVQRRIADRYRADFIVLTKAGHVPMIEGGAHQTIMLILKWLKLQDVVKKGGSMSRSGENDLSSAWALVGPVLMGAILVAIFLVISDSCRGVLLEAMRAFFGV